MQENGSSRQRRIRGGARSGVRGRAAWARASSGRRASRSPTRRSIFWATAPCAICWARSARAASAGTTRAICATGIEAIGRHEAPEFGDTLNLDASATVLNARPAPGRVAPVRRHAGPRVRGPRRRAGRVSELLRDGDHARLQSQHDPLRRGSLHAAPSGSRWRSRNSIRQQYPGDSAEPGAVPRLGRGDAASASSGA